MLLDAFQRIVRAQQLRREQQKRHMLASMVRTYDRKLTLLAPMVKGAAMQACRRDEARNDA